MGRRVILKGPAIPDLTQPTIFVTQDTFFALSMGCSSPDIAVNPCVAASVAGSALENPRGV